MGAMLAKGLQNNKLGKYGRATKRSAVALSCVEVQEMPRTIG
jgi:hypothetical protein